MRARFAAGLALIPFLLLSQTAGAQTEILYDFEVAGPTDQVVDVVHLQESTVTILFRDLSRDTAGGLVPGGTPTDVPVGAHEVTWRVETGEDANGWVVTPPPPFTSMGGQQYEVPLRVLATAGVDDPYLPMTLVANITTQFGHHERELLLTFFTPGVPGFVVSAQGSIAFGPRDTATANLVVRSLARLPQVVVFEVVENPCGLAVSAPASMTLAGRASDVRAFTVQGPEDKFWYNSESCLIRVEAHSNENPDLVRSTVVGVDVDGFYVDPMWVFWTVVAIGSALLLFLLAKRTKEREEEEIRGKPQKPWLIPVERVYLRHLRQRDPRAWYVVRHHLMEEEYRSALLWYHAVRKATRGNDKKERLVLRHERRYEAWRRRWDARIGVPERRLARFEAKLQGQLERDARKRHRKRLKRHSRDVRRIEAAAAKRAGRELARWRKQADKAAKKGHPAPPQPARRTPDLPPEPVLEVPALAQHPLAKRLARAERATARRRGDLEVRFEKADARRLHALRRKVRRIAKRLDDPEFVRDHPLLYDAPGAPAGKSRT